MMRLLLSISVVLLVLSFAGCSSTPVLPSVDKASEEHPVNTAETAAAIKARQQK